MTKPVSVKGGTRLTWYNRKQRKFRNGVVWVRVVTRRHPNGGWGLWWKDTRVKGLNPVEDYPGRKISLGPFRVSILTPRSN